jgi:hypothetical protein
VGTDEVRDFAEGSTRWLLHRRLRPCRGQHGGNTAREHPLADLTLIRSKEHVMELDHELGELDHELDTGAITSDIHKATAWSIVLSVLMIAAGVLAIASPALAGVAVTVSFGWL